MNVPNLLVAATLLTAALSGCIAYSDSTDTQTNGAQTTHPGATPPAHPFRDGPAALDVLHTSGWSGQGGPQDTFDVPRDYDVVQVTFVHSGQMLGQTATRAGDGEQYDDGLLRSQNGGFALIRTLSGAAGTGSVDFTGLMSGSGALIVMGYDNAGVPPLLSLSWSGQSTNPVVFDNRFHFYVPEGLSEVQLTLAGSGQSAPGIRITDPNGDEQAQISGSGGAVDDKAVTATAGVWTVHLEGIANGSFTAGAIGILAP